MLGSWKRWFGKKEDTQIPSDASGRLALLEKTLNLSIPKKDQHFFLKALRHRSIVNQQHYAAHETYERLEFLGDAVLDLIVSEIIFEKYPDKDEGYLTKLRAKIVKGDTLSMMAKKLKLNDVLEVGERAAGQGIELSKSVLADVYEAVIAAIYLSQGYDKTFSFVRSNLKELLDIETIEKKVDNYKSMLMEYSQSEKIPLPEYRVLSEEGPGHDKTFKVVVYLNDKKSGEGIGKSKKQAEQVAAKNTLSLLGILN